MESLRVKAINDLSTKSTGVVLDGSEKITAIFQENVFTTRTAREFLSDEAFKSLTGSIKGGTPLIATTGHSKPVLERSVTIRSG